MINNKKVLVIIPARGGSKGLVGKNIKNLCGKPLIGWPIQAAKNCTLVDKIVVSTDDSDIAKIALTEGAEIPFMRPDQLAKDTSSTISVIEYTLNQLSDMGEIFEYCILLEPTSPLTENSDIEKALQILDSNLEIADSIVGVSEVVSAHPVFDNRIGASDLIEPFLEVDYSNVGRRQELEKLYFFEGSIYVSTVAALQQNQSFYHDRTLPYIVPKWKSFEIDDIVDFVCIEAIINNLSRIKEDADERSRAME